MTGIENSRRDQNVQSGARRRLPKGTLSIVTTCFRSEDTIVSFVHRALAAGTGVASDVELIVVDDGSPDRSSEIVRELADADNRIALVILSRNFGHHRAMLAGLEHAGGDHVFLIDSDLEEAPENLGKMVELLVANRADCVYGLQAVRKGAWFERVTGEAFYWLFAKLSSVKMPRNVSTMRLMTRRYVRSLLLFRDRNPVLVPLSLITGYRQVEFSFTKTSSSPTTYGLWRRFSLLVHIVTSFSSRPLSLMFGLSLILAAAGFTYFSYVVLRVLLGFSTQEGWSSLMAAVAMLFSVNALFTGVLGLYIKNILDEVRDRPRTIVQEVYRRDAKVGARESQTIDVHESEESSPSRA